MEPPNSASLGGSTSEGPCGSQRSPELLCPRTLGLKGLVRTVKPAAAPFCSVPCFPWYKVLGSVQNPKGGRRYKDVNPRELSDHGPRAGLTSRGWYRQLIRAPVLSLLLRSLAHINQGGNAVLRSPGLLPRPPWRYHQPPAFQGAAWVLWALPPRQHACPSSQALVRATPFASSCP